ncbi:15170_t:CDS:2 [Funneliformis caledonium]|uniref:15170_t:CDS:1 n=1 Tax=Funneliformis caledonium TaxID=1117310 RepID=A0A9N9BDC3_9GLOM|nr:15170_t:CDS:2 [Funneliformis caledonium]
MKAQNESYLKIFERKVKHQRRKQKVHLESHLTAQLKATCIEKLALNQTHLQFIKQNGLSIANEISDGNFLLRYHQFESELENDKNDEEEETSNDEDFIDFSAILFDKFTELNRRKMVVEKW